MLGKKIKYLVVGLAIILFVLPSVVHSGRLESANENRDCYNSWLVPDVLPLWICTLQSQPGVMEASFLDYPTMHDFYTPQLKEHVYTTGNQAVLSQKRTIGTMTVTGAPSFVYAKGKYP